MTESKPTRAADLTPMKPVSPLTKERFLREIVPALRCIASASIAEAV